MFPPSSRLLRISGVAVVVLLVGLALSPGTLASPYAPDTPRYDHQIVPESSTMYEEVVEGSDPAVYQYDELSPVAQELFDRTRAAETQQYTPTVCRNFMLVCDTYAEDELPEEFTYGTELTDEEAFVFVEDGDERYLFQTGTTGHLFLAPFPTGFALSWLTMLPLAAFIAVVTGTSASDRVLGAVVSSGVLVATLGVVAPYIEFAGLAPAWVLGVLLLGGVWIGILTAGGYTLYQRVAHSERRSSPDES